VRLEEGRIHANVALPGLALRYRFDDVAPDGGSPRYGAPLSIPPDARTLSIASFDTRGRSSRSATIALKDAFDV